MGRFNKTKWKYSCGKFIKRQTLHRGFDTFEAAQAFATGKKTLDIFKAKGRWVVEWIKETEYEESAVRVVIEDNGKTKFIID